MKVIAFYIFAFATTLSWSQKLFNNGYFRVDKDSVIRVGIDNYIEYIFPHDEAVVLEINFSEGVFFLNGVARNFKGHKQTELSHFILADPTNYRFEYLPHGGEFYILNSFKPSETNYNIAIESREYPGEDSITADGYVPYPAFKLGQANSVLCQNNGTEITLRKNYFAFLQIEGVIGGLYFEKDSFNMDDPRIEFYSILKNEIKYEYTDTLGWINNNWRFIDIDKINDLLNGEKNAHKKIGNHLIFLKDSSWSMRKIKKYYSYFQLEPGYEIQNCDSIYNIQVAPELIIAKRANQHGYRIWLPERTWLKEQDYFDCKKAELKNYVSVANGFDATYNNVILTLDDSNHFLIKTLVASYKESGYKRIKTNNPEEEIYLNSYTLDTIPNFTLNLD